eukprot:6669044-Prymnesium_polylepis.1
MASHPRFSALGVEVNGLCWASHSTSWRVPGFGPMSPCSRACLSASTGVFELPSQPLLPWCST